MVSNVLWNVGTNGYISAAQTLLDTQLNALATATMCAAGTAIDNSAGDKAIWADFEFLAGGTFTPLANGYISVWFLRTLNGGTNYEDGSASITPPRKPDLIIPVRAGTTITPRAGRPMIVLPPGQFEGIAMNNTGATLPATGNTIKFRTYAQAQ